MMIQEVNHNNTDYTIAIGYTQDGNTGVKVINKKTNEIEYEFLVNTALDYMYNNYIVRIEDMEVNDKTYKELCLLLTHTFIKEHLESELLSDIPEVFIDKIKNAVTEIAYIVVNMLMWSDYSFKIEN